MQFLTFADFNNQNDLILKASSETFFGRIIDIGDTLNDMDIISLLFGGIFSPSRNKLVCESGLISIVSIYGLPMTLIYILQIFKVYGKLLSFVFIVFSIVYNPMSMFPICIVFPLLFSSKNSNGNFLYKFTEN